MEACNPDHTNMTTLTVAERALDLFSHYPTGENRIDWLANQLLALAAESRSLSLRIVRDEKDDGPVLECSDSVHVVVLKDSGPLRLFRTLLARFAKMAEEENGTEFTPYGGKLHFDRPGPAGPVRLDIEFVNTTVVQWLKLAKAVALV
jgi:hypothetical protein